MHRITIARTLARRSSTIIAVTPRRSVQTSQGHTTSKSKDPLHKDKDVQSASATAGMQNKDASQGSSGGADQPLDAARQGGLGGESKVAPEGKGAFADQVGGQKGGAQQGAGQKGGTEKTGDESVMGKVLDTFGGRKASNTRSYHTSARALNRTTPRADPEGARKPVDAKVHGDQNPHLKHTKGGSEGSAKTGNAAPDPHLPSHSTSSSAGSNKSASPFGSSPSAQQTRKFHVSQVGRLKGIQGEEKYAGSHQPEPAKAGYDSPSEPLPSSLKSAYPTNDPNAAPSPPAGATPSSRAERSSTSTDTAHPTLGEAAKSGGLADRNPQPSADVGRKGVKEAWKDRKA